MTAVPGQRKSATTPRNGCTECSAQALARDSLTGLADRSMLTHYLRHALETRRASPDRRPAVLFCDLDRFKVINDSLGRDAGDRLLVIMAQRLEETVARARCASALVGRIAADEFVVVCDHVDSVEAATDLASHIHRALGEAVTLGDDHVKMRLSIGVALAGPQVTYPEDLIRHAEAANARAKSQGRDRIETFDARMQRRAHSRLRTEMDLSGACERSELLLHYQPILHLGEQRVTGIEALVRWQHPQRGLLWPGEFIPLAEETGLIREIGAWVMEEAFTQSRRWHRAGIDNVRVGVNVSARQLGQHGFVDSVAELLDRLGPDEVLPHMELTESVLMADPDASARILAELRELGIRLSLDDFGTGYSSLAYLQRFPVDVLKIDRSFVAGIDRAPRNRALVGAIVQLGHALDMLVLAEGVETDGEREVVTDLGCDLLQGFLIARPAPADHLPLPGFLPEP